MELAFDLFYSSQARPIIPSPSSPSDRGALAALRASEWNMELAFDLFYSSSTSGQQLRALGRSAAPKVDPRQLEHLFLRYKVVHAGMSFVVGCHPLYKLIQYSSCSLLLLCCFPASDPHCDLILVDGVSKLCEDLEVDPQDIVMLILSWHFKAATMCEYSKEEFMQGMQRLGVSSAGELKARLPALRSEINDDLVGGRGRGGGKRGKGGCVEGDAQGKVAGTAMTVGSLFAAAAAHTLHSHLLLLCLQGSQVSGIRHGHWHVAAAVRCFYSRPSSSPSPSSLCPSAVSRYALQGQKSLAFGTAIGMWQLLFTARPWRFVEHWCEYLQITDPSLSSYDEEGAWPYLVDEFVSHLREEGVVPSKPDAA
ncbi:unnamed protein product [Closterium sp. NIES-65]|nr:unnamed protein product [Closterium sp. NIES-65]